MTKRRKRDLTAASTQNRRLWLVGGLILIMALGIGWRLTTRTASTAAPAILATANSITATAILPVHRIKDASEVPAGQAEQVQLIYFHRTQRCEGCIAGERLTRQTLDTYFTGQMSSGLVSITSLDVQAPENSAIAQKYGASGSALYFSVRKGGAEYLYAEEEIWFVLNDEAKFMALLRDKILSVLG